MIQAILAYVLLASLLAIEVFLRQGTPARSLETTDSDKGSAMLIDIAVTVLDSGEFESKIFRSKKG